MLPALLENFTTPGVLVCVCPEEKCRRVGARILGQGCKLGIGGLRAMFGRQQFSAQHPEGERVQRARLEHLQRLSTAVLLSQERSGQPAPGLRQR